jgi:hypothetical protein
MGQTTSDPNTVAILLDLLKGAAQAHGVHEKETGKPDPDWPQWYAEHMTRTLRDAGYRISRASSP